MALHVKAEAPFVFSISASRPNLDNIKVDATDLQGAFDDASKKSVTFTKGDCSLRLKLAGGAIEVVQTGACTSIDLPADMTLDTSLDAMDAATCWNVPAHSFATKDGCSEF